MDNKVLLQDLSNGVSKRSGLGKRESETFVRSFFAVIEQYLQEEKIVKVKGLGTFKVVEVSGRDSVNVNTGERFHIKGHSKITFTPDAAIRDHVNRPFADFDTIILNEGVDLAAMEYVEVPEDVTLPDDEDVTINSNDDLEKTIRPDNSNDNGEEISSSAQDAPTITPQELVETFAPTDDLQVEAALDSAVVENAVADNLSDEFEELPDSVNDEALSAEEEIMEASTDDLSAAETSHIESSADNSSADNSSIDETTAITEPDVVEQIEDECVADETINNETNAEDSATYNNFEQPEITNDDAHRQNVVDESVDDFAEDENDPYVALEKTLRLPERDEIVAESDCDEFKEEVTSQLLETTQRNSENCEVINADSADIIEQESHNNEGSSLTQEDKDVDVSQDVVAEDVERNSSCDTLNPESHNVVSDVFEKVPIDSMADGNDSSDNETDPTPSAIIEATEESTINDSSLSDNVPEQDSENVSSLQNDVAEDTSVPVSSLQNDDVEESSECIVTASAPARTKIAKDAIRPRYVVSHSTGNQSNSNEENISRSSSWLLRFFKWILFLVLIILSYFAGTKHLLGGDCKSTPQMVEERTARNAQTVAENQNNQLQPENEQTDDNSFVENDEFADEDVSVVIPQDEELVENEPLPVVDNSPVVRPNSNGNQPAANTSVQNSNTSKNPTTLSDKPESNPAANYPQVNGGAYEIVGVQCKYALKRGETVSVLSRKFLGDTKLNEYIIKLNNLSNPDLVEVGQVLKIPQLRLKKR